MIDLRDIRSLTEFKRHTADFLARLKETGKPQVLTVNGRAEVVVQDAESYQRLMEVIERAEAIEGIRHGLDDLESGRTRHSGQRRFARGTQSRRFGPS